MILSENWFPLSGSCFEPPDQCHGGGGSADFSLANEINKDVARRRARRFLVDAGEVGGCAALRPQTNSLGPLVKGRGRIAGCDRILPLLQPCIDKIAGDVRYCRIG